jgi:hypothetical protein
MMFRLRMTCLSPSRPCLLPEADPEAVKDTAPTVGERALQMADAMPVQANSVETEPL